ncbi:MAG: Do family serine endopeptidase [Myxococcales bacterium]|nr:Do family serine endopeptidase [Myxococcales bacterium]
MAFYALKKLARSIPVSRFLVGWLVFAACSPLACLHNSEAQEDTRGSGKTTVASRGGSAPLPNTGAVADAQRLGDAISTVAERVSPAVVSMRVETRREVTQNPLQFFFGPFGGEGGAQQAPVVRGSGSGIVVRADGYLVTNNHVVDNASRIEVQLQDGRQFSGKVIGTDPATDLAVVKVNAKNLPTVSFAAPDDLRVGQWVVAIGSPFGLDYTVTAGVLSAVGRGGIGANEIEDYLQTDASINPGNSGGPLVNLRGEVLGINTMIVGRGTGIGFAVPAALARNVTDQLIATGKVRRAWIGVAFQELTPELAKQFGVNASRGALVSHVEATGPAAKGGVKSGDIIQAVDGIAIKEGRDLLRSVLTKPIGQKITLDVIRQGKKQRLSLITAERPRGKDDKPAASDASRGSSVAPGYGLQVQSLTPPIAEQLGIQRKSGLVVANVESGSPADRAGLRGGDLIVEADRSPVEKPGDLSRALSDGKALLQVERRGGSFFAVLSQD